MTGSNIAIEMQDLSGSSADPAAANALAASNGSTALSTAASDDLPVFTTPAAGAVVGFAVSMGWQIAQQQFGKWIYSNYGPETAEMLGFGNRQQRLLQESIKALTATVASVQDIVKANNELLRATLWDQFFTKFDDLSRLISQTQQGIGTAQRDGFDSTTAKNRVAVLLTTLNPDNKDGIFAQLHELWELAFQENFPFPVWDGASDAHSVNINGFVKTYLESLLRNGMEADQFYKQYLSLLSIFAETFSELGYCLYEARNFVFTRGTYSDKETLDSYSIDPRWFVGKDLGDKLSVGAWQAAHRALPDVTELLFRLRGGSGVDLGLWNLHTGNMLESNPENLPVMRDSDGYDNPKPLYCDFPASKLSSIDTENPVNVFRIWHVEAVEGAPSTITLARTDTTAFFTVPEITHPSGMRALMPMTGIVQGFVTGPVPFKSYVLRGSVRRLSYGTYRMATPYLSVTEFNRRGSVVSKNDPEVTMLSIDPGLERRWFWWADINKAAADLPALPPSEWIKDERELYSNSDLDRVPERLGYIVSLSDPTAAHWKMILKITDDKSLGVVLVNARSNAMLAVETDVSSSNRRQVYATDKFDASLSPKKSQMWGWRLRKVTGTHA